MTKRECMAEWFYNRGYWKTDIDAMGDTEITENFCDAQDDCVGCQFANDCPPIGDDEICEWIHLEFRGDIDEA